MLRPVYSSCELTPWYLAEELRRPFGSKDFAVLEITVFGPDVRLKHIDGFTETMFKTTTDGILLLIFARQPWLALPWHGKSLPSP